MLLNVKYKTISRRNLKSGEVRKILSEAGISVKGQKLAIRKALDDFRGIKKHIHSQGHPFVTVVASSVRREEAEAVGVDLEVPELIMGQGAL